MEGANALPIAHALTNAELSAALVVSGRTEEALEISDDSVYSDGWEGVFDGLGRGAFDRGKDRACERIWGDGDGASSHGWPCAWSRMDTSIAAFVLH